MPVVDEKIYPSPYFLVKEFHETYGQPVRLEPVLEVPEKALRFTLVEEEAEEYEEALDNDDLIEIADALADILYVAYGAAITHGLTIDGGRLAAEAPEGAPTVPTFFIEDARVYLEDVKTAVAGYRLALDNNDLVGVEEALTALVKACYVASYAHGIDIDDVLAEVQRSNLSKLGVDGKPIYRENDNKVLKGPNFFVPDVEKILLDQGWDGTPFPVVEKL